MITTLILTALVLLGGLQPALQFEPGGALWRVVTCHFTHWTYEQLAWDVLALFALGVACERRDRAAFHATLLASAVVIPIAVLVFAPEIVAYRGMSGIDSALFVLLLAQNLKRSKWAVALAVAFIGKITFELFTASAVFASDLGNGVVAVPVAHIAGAITALIVSTYTHGSCASSSPCSSR